MGSDRPVIGLGYSTQIQLADYPRQGKIVQILHVPEAERWLLPGGTTFRSGRSVRQRLFFLIVFLYSQSLLRGIYCLLVVATLLDILTPELLENTAEFISSCQTYEGGFASASHPSYSLSGEFFPFAPHPSLGEAHGGYTFCSLASWVLLQPYLSLSPVETRPTIDLNNLLRWLVHMQGVEVELGGFKGRTNKLVDGCYSWWCGGSFSLLEALGVHGSPRAESDTTKENTTAGVWDDIDGEASFTRFNSDVLNDSC
jgi:protein farnesyltransferase subunit beta